MEMQSVNIIRTNLRQRLTEYRYFSLGKENSIHINAVEISLCLVDYAIEKKRAISKDEEKWFNAGWEIIQVFENSDWEDIIELYNKLCDLVEKKNYFRT